MSKELKKFLKLDAYLWLIIPAVGCLLMIASTISMLVRGNFEVVAPLILIVISALGTIPFFVRISTLKKLEENPLLPQMETDFRSAFPMRKDTVRFGQYWIFSRSSKKVINYSDITRVYQNIHKTNFIEDSRSIMFVDQNGKPRELCKLELRGKSDEEVKQIFMIILQKNPNVALGYR